MSQSVQTMAGVYSLLSDPTRLKILQAITGGSELCVGDLASLSGASMSATSHQLRKLELAGIVSKCRYGKEICYCLNASRNAVLIRKLITISHG